MIRRFNHIQNLMRTNEPLSSYPNLCISPPQEETVIESFVKESRKVPEEYVMFLECCDGIKNFWKGFHFVGIQGFNEENTHILRFEVSSVQKAVNEYRVSKDDEEEIRNWEARTIQYYLPHYFIFATNMGNEILFFNQYNKNKDGLCEIVWWNVYEGVKGHFEGLDSLIKIALE